MDHERILDALWTPAMLTISKCPTYADPKARLGHRARKVTLFESFTTIQE
jgi:hypothetical protein